MRIRIPFTDRVLELRRSTLANPDPWLIDWFSGGGQAASGVRVTEASALQNTVVLACVRILAETVASLPLLVYQRLPTGGRERAVTHRLYPLLHDQPNPEMTSFEFREALMGHLMLWGNAYAEIERDNAGRVLALWPLRPDRMRVDRDGQGLRYAYTLPNSTEVLLRQRAITHLRGLSGDGVIGYSPIRMMREAIGLAMATEEFGARLFAQGAMPRGVIERPANVKWSPDGRKRFREEFEAFHTGLTRAHRLAILEDGMTWKQIGIPPEDAQFLESRRFQIAEIARAFRVPLHLVNEADKAATYASVEQFHLSFIVHTLRPWLVRLEQAFTRDLFVPEERDTYYAEFLVDGLLRGDTESRYRAYATARTWGWMSADDVREKENMNPLPDGQGKIYLAPLNMTPAAQMMQPAEAASLRQFEQRNQRRLPARARRPAQYRAVFQSAATRLVRWETNELDRLVEAHLRQAFPDAAAFGLAMEQFYRADRTPERIKRYIQPTVESYARIIADDVVDEIGGELAADWVDVQSSGYAGIFTRDYIESSRGQLMALTTEPEPEAAITTRLAEWRERRPDKIADWETVAAAGVFARGAMAALGVTKLRWAATGSKPCPYCLTVDGSVVGIEEAFAMGEVPAEGEEPMRLWRNPRNPPLHEGCACMIMPG